MCPNQEMGTVARKGVRPANAKIVAMLLHHLLEARADEFSDKVALVCRSERFTYSELDKAAGRVANALIANGVTRGARVAVYLPNSPETVIAIYGVLKADAVFVVLHPGIRPDKLAYILNDCGAAALFVDVGRTSLEQLDHLRKSVPSLGQIIACTGGLANPAPDTHLIGFEQIQKQYPDAPPPSRNIDLDLACLIYTSGTTGEPKGVMCDHSNVLFAASSIVQYLKNTGRDIVLNVLPLSFDYGLYQLLMTVMFGGTLVLEDSFAYPAEILKRIEKEAVTGFPGVPTIFSMLLQLPLHEFDLHSLRYVTNTAAALPPGHIQRLRQALPSSVDIYSMYGLTETKRTLYLPPDQLDRRAGSVGIAIPGTEVWIEDSQGLRLGPDQVGELVVRGRHVMRGYWRAPDMTAARFPPGPIPGERLCRTGDLFRMDQDGYYYFVGRSDEMIKSRGEKVAPREIENVLYALSGITEAAVVGVPDPILGAAIKAFVVSSDATLDRRRVLAWCREHLEEVMVPRYIEFRDQLPKNASGKIARNLLV